MLEGRLLAMLENVPNLTLDALNHATQAWVEMEYNLALVRADLVAAMSPESVAASEIPLQRLAATRHLMAQMGKPSRRS